MDLLLGVLAALGALVFLWCVALLILSPLTGRGMVTVWYVRGDCEDLEFRVRCCVLLQKLGLLSARLVLADEGLSAAARLRAEALVRELVWVDLISACDVDTYFDLMKAE